MELDILLSKQEIVNDVAAELNLFGRTLELGASTEDKAADNLKDLANYIRTPDDNETKPIVARAMQEGWNAVKEICQRYNAFGRKYDDNRLEAIVTEENSTTQFSAEDFPFNDETPSNPIIGLGEILAMQPNTTYHFHLLCTGIHNNPGTLMFFVGGHKLGEFELSPEAHFDYKTDKAEENVQITIHKKDVEMPDIHLSYGSKVSLIYTFNQYGNYNLQLVMPDNFNVSVTSSITSHAHRLIVDNIVAAVLKNQQQEGYTKYLATAEKARQELLRSLQARNSFGRVQHDWM